MAIDEAYQFDNGGVKAALLGPVFAAARLVTPQQIVQKLGLAPCEVPGTFDGLHDPKTKASFQLLGLFVLGEGVVRGEARLGHERPWGKPILLLLHCSHR
jgi:hypothetical protein